MSRNTSAAVRVARRARLRSDPRRGPAFEAWRRWRDDPGPLGIVAAGVLAPSPHNTQPWWFVLGDGTIDVVADTSRHLHSADPFRRELWTALGCATENLTLAARARGFDPVVVVRPEAAQPLVAARVHLVPAPTHADDLYDMIGDRHSDRGPFLRQPIPPSVLDRFSAVTPDLAPATLTWVTDPVERARLGALLVRAAHAVAADGAQSRDSFDWFRPDARSIDAHRDGLTLDVLGLSPRMTELAKLLPPASRQRADAFWVRRTRDVHTRTAAAYGLVLVPNPHDPAQRIAGGRLLERLHLLATSEQLGFQHMNQITERIDRDDSLGRSSDFAARLAEFVPASGRQVLALFRLGHPARPGGTSPRRPAAEVLGVDGTLGSAHGGAVAAK